MFVHPQIKLNIKNLKLFFGKSSEKELKEKLSRVFPNCHFLFTDSGRSAFQVAIKELGIENSEMIIPAYICDIFEPILKQYNIKPIFLDTNLKTFHADLLNIESKITPETKSILICHTYGLPVEMDKILEIARKYNLKIIEDCAHIFPIKISGDCAFFSFAKLFSIINGGMLVSKNPIKTNLPQYKFRLFNVIKFLRLFPKLARFTELFRRNPKETQRESSKGNPRGISKGSLRIFDQYSDNYENLILKRKELAEYFQKKLIELGFEVQEAKNNTFTYISALTPDNLSRDKLFNELRKQHIFCSRIWQKPIYPNLSNTSTAAKRIINFPLQAWFTEKDIDKIISCILSIKG